MLLGGKDDIDPEVAAARRLALLPARSGGLGLQCAARTAPATYWAAWADALPLAKSPLVRAAVHETQVRVQQDAFQKRAHHRHGRQAAAGLSRAAARPPRQAVGWGKWRWGAGVEAGVVQVGLREDCSCRGWQRLVA